LKLGEEANFMALKQHNLNFGSNIIRLITLEDMKRNVAKSGIQGSDGDIWLRIRPNGVPL
jgi:hypothetical protein